MIPEILAPASSESLQAAVRGGADAVYLGAGNFNARARAHNFSNDTLRRAVEYCHVRGVRVYLTMNTLVHRDEMADALQLAAYAGSIGVDALILQDLGLARQLHAAMPTMPLHASTQMTCHSPAGVRLLRDLGFSRVILSREMSLREISACCGLGCEIEVFVHGALCMSVSGQCYLSSVLGGRSGNRGACAQPCRLPFRAGAHASPARDCFALSLRDNCLYDHIRQLADAGVTSLKIEGRMKRPEYVAAAAAVYKQAVTAGQADAQLLQDLQAVFSRSGFTDGYLTGKRGAPMFGTRRYQDVTAADSGVLSRLAQLYQKEMPRVSVAMHLRTESNGTAALKVTDCDGNTVCVQADVAQQAQKTALTAAYAAGQLRKTGGTPFTVSDVTADLAEGMTVTAGALNALRRDALTELEMQRSQAHTADFDQTALPEPLASKTDPQDKPPLVVRLATKQQVLAALQQPKEADLWVLPLDIVMELGQRLQPLFFAVEIPRGLFGTEETVRTQLQKACSLGARAALCGNIGALSLCRQLHIPAVAGFGNNLCNRAAADAVYQCGARAGVWSFELSGSAVPTEAPMPMGIFAYGRQPLMLTRNCPVSAVKGCGGCNRIAALTDRTATVFPVMCSGGCSELLNAHTLYMADKLKQLPRADFWYLHMTDEDADLCLQTIRQYRVGGSARPSITRGTYGRSTT